MSIEMFAIRRQFIEKVKTIIVIQSKVISIRFFMVDEPQPDSGCRRLDTF